MAESTIPEPDEKQITPGSYKYRVLLTVGVVATTALLILVFWFAASVFLAIFVGILFAIFLRGLAGLVSSKTGLSESVSLGVVVTLGLTIVVGGGWLLADPISVQAEQLYETLPQSIETLLEDVRSTQVGSWLLENISSNGIGSNGQESFLSQLTGIFSSTLGAIATFILFLFVSVFLAANPAPYKSGFISLFPKARRERVSEIINEVIYTLKWWLFGQFIAMLIIGIASFIALAIIGVPLAMTHAVLAAILTFIPNIGPVVSAVPPALMALMDSPTKMMWVIVAYLIIQTIESNFVTPLIHKRTVFLPPAITITAQLILGVLFGLIGLVVATPLTAALIVIVKMAYIEDVLHDEIELPSEGHAH